MFLLFLFQNCGSQNQFIFNEQEGQATSEQVFQLPDGLQANLGAATSVSSSVNRTLPKVLVNHDLYVHTDWGLQIPGGEKKSSYVKSITNTAQAEADALAAVLGNHSELALLEAGLNVSSTYGGHDLFYWGRTDQTYNQWIRGLLGGNSNAYLSSGSAAIDTLILKKLRSGDSIFSDILAQKSTAQPLIVSVRMNDHHHLNDAQQFLGPWVNLPFKEPGFSRKLAAVSPDYLDFLSREMVISGVANPVLGKKGLGLGCDTMDSEGQHSYHLDYAENDVLMYQVKKLTALFRNHPNLDGVELDFLRSNCFFNEGVPKDRRKFLMNYLFTQVYRLKADFLRINGRNPFVVVRVPLEDAEDEALGLDVAALANNTNIDGIIFGYSKPYLRSQIKVPSLPIKHANLKIYYELYQITDNQLSGTQNRRRPASRSEILTAAYEALRAGYDGISLFNFHYAYKDNPLLKPEYAGQAVTWSSIVNPIKNLAQLKQINPIYYFNFRNSDGVFTPRLNGDPASVVFRLATADRTLSETAAFRVIVEGLTASDVAAWRAVSLNVRVNGVSVVASNGLPLAMKNSSSYGRDPIRFYQEDLMTPWSPESSKDIVIPRSRFRNMSNRIEVHVASDPQGFFAKTKSRIQMQLSF